ncbi:hypothetical protein NUM3379_08810 [Kineococcus sp. NUM-3379]
MTPTPRSPGRTGRPRAAAAGRPGSTGSTRGDILDAAAELFTAHGFTRTSTRALGEAAGVRQATLYYHFAGKDEVLAELLDATVRPSLELAERLVAREGPPAVHLHALARFDAGLLAGSRWNVGALYLLPEARGEAHRGFWSRRERLVDAYRALARAAAPEPARAALADPVAAAVPMAIVESVIHLRAQVTDAAATALTLADACLRAVGVPAAQVPALAAGSDAVLAAEADGVPAEPDAAPAARLP